jgi:GT2 family glycosyltransferase
MVDLDVSVIIATRNRARLLEQTLEHLAAQQTAELSWEVIVVDNGSSDGTREVLERMCDQLPIVVLTESIPGKNRALNRAVAVARGKLLLFTDDDVIVDPQWMGEMQRAVGRWPFKTIFAGAITPTFEAEVPTWIREPQFTYSRLVFCEFAPRDTEGPIEQRAFGANVGLRREALDGIQLSESVGPIGRQAAPMGSETSLLRALEDNGYRTVFIPSAHVRHVITSHQVRTGNLMKRAFRAGRSDVLFEAPSEQVGVMTLWKRTIKPILHCMSACFQSRLVKLERGMDLCRSLGRVYQRQLGDRPRRAVPAPARPAVK